MGHGTPRTIHSASAFTLVELLIVVAVIGTLAGLLFPAVNLVRAAAERASCSTNLRQISMAVVAYAGDCQGQLPYSKWYPSTVMMTWEKDFLAPYLREQDINFTQATAESSSRSMGVYKCKTARRMIKAYNNNTSISDYGLNGGVFPNWQGATGFWNLENRLVKVSSQAYLATDTAISNEKVRIFCSPSLQAWYSANSSGNLDFRHGDRLVMAHFDGSVKSLKATDMPAESYAGYKSNNLIKVCYAPWGVVTP